MFVKRSEKDSNVMFLLKRFEKNSFFVMLCYMLFSPILKKFIINKTPFIYNPILFLPFYMFFLHLSFIKVLS